ncbi:hypothetical protein ACQPYH_27705 [Kribbella sp. CA-245084]|uniref:hypothetical protein n=1 Tax=Kribbella sp. CA-245084 TaxID=3239940 RepID=UPI003D92096D
MGSDITNVVRECVATGRFGAAAHGLPGGRPLRGGVGVHQGLVVTSTATLDAMHGTAFAQRCRERIAISYPAVDGRRDADHRS